MKVAITGASGFLGRYLVKVLTEQGHQCRGLSRRAIGSDQVEWVVGSMEDEQAIRSLVEGVGAVVHAGFDRAGGGFLDQPSDVPAFVERNVVGTIRLIEAARMANVERFVVISSGAVHDVILGDRPLDETHPLWPKTHYGATKAAIEAFVHSYGKGQGWGISALRPTSIHGLAEPITSSRWHDLIATVVRGEDVTCLRGGKQVHAVDVARASAILLTAEGVTGEVYHCADLFVSEREVAELAQKIAQTRGRISGEAPSARNPIGSEKLRKLGMNFGGRDLLEATIAEMVHSIEAKNPSAT